MKVQQVSKKQEIRFGKSAIITSEYPGALHMLKNDVDAIARNVDKNIKAEIKKGALLINDGVKDDIAPAIVDTNGYSGALRSEFDKITKSEDIIGSIVKAFENHFGIVRLPN